MTSKDKIEISFLVDEDTCNFKVTSMFIGMPYCDGKCWKDLNKEAGYDKYDWPLCHNHDLLNDMRYEITTEKLVERYLHNPLSHGVVFGGMEPLLSSEEVLEFIRLLRLKNCEDPVVIYTGYTEQELPVLEFVKKAQSFNNIFMKLGRYRPGEERHLDKVLGVELASSNQYGKQIS